MNEWELIWQSRDVFVTGLVNTILLFVLSFMGAFFTGCLVCFFLEEKGVFNRFLRLYISVMRMLPFLVFVYLIYYGLPQFNLKIDAWHAGVTALALYHGGYFAEILRGSRLTLPPGQVEAAKAFGFSQRKMFIRIVLPQILFRSRALIGNQMVYALKDTAFLSIITVQELTAAANMVQSNYFIPTKAFFITIFFYLLLSILMDVCLKRVGHHGVKRGFEHA